MALSSVVNPDQSTTFQIKKNIFFYLFRIILTYFQLYVINFTILKIFNNLNFAFSLLLMNFFKEITCCIRLPLIFFFIIIQSFPLLVNNLTFKILFNNSTFTCFLLPMDLLKLNEIPIISQLYEVNHCINSNCLYVHIRSTRGVRKFEPFDPTRRPTS